MLAIRMQRTGRSGHAQFRVIVQDSRFSPTRGRVVSYLGSYDPHTKTSVIDSEKAAQYLQNGARPSNSVALLFKKEGIKLPAWVKMDEPKKRDVRNPEKRRSTSPAAPEAPAEPASEAPAQEAGAEPVPEEAPGGEETPAESPEAVPAKETPAQAPESETNAAETETPSDQSPSTEENKPEPENS
jgi:small subunit ribosomal protein S16